MIIAAVNSKGGVGKTTISVHLTDWFGVHGWTACLVDCDAQRLSSRWLAAASPETPSFVMDSSEQIASELPSLASSFEPVVVDAPGGLGEITGAILAAADAIFIPTGPSNLDIMALDWATSTVHEIQRLRNGQPQAVIIPVQASPRRLTTKHLMEKARGLGFGVTNTVVPYRQIYAKAAGLEDRPPRLLWQLGRSKEVRQASLELDALFQEVFPEACEQSPERIAELVQPRTFKCGEMNDAERKVANG